MNQLKPRRQQHLFVSKHFMRNITIILLLIFQSFGGFTQGHPECVDPCLCLSGFVSNKYWAKAKIKIDSCVKTNFGKDNLIAWYIRGKVYQGIYESNDSRYLNLKDSSLYKAKTSYVKSFCLNINSDTIDFNQLLNDSTYRLKI